jgi:hypothetical protein
MKNNTIVIDRYRRLTFPFWLLVNLPEGFQKFVGLCLAATQVSLQLHVGVVRTLDARHGALRDWPEIGSETEMD